MSIPFEKSFASHNKSIYWSDKNTVTSNEICLNSGRKIIFKCDECNHTFNMKPIDISIRNRWCPYCANIRLCRNNNCNICYNKSFASYWRSWWLSEENNVNVWEIQKYSNKKYIFKCNLCYHKFISSPNSVSLGIWCRYCVNQELCSNENCTYCFKKSFKRCVL